MLESSAMPHTIKRAACIQEVMRRLRNTQRDLPWEERAEIISQFSHTLMISGYGEKLRLELIQSAVQRYEAQCDREYRV